VTYTKIKVSGEKLIDTIREVSNEHPDYLYEAPQDMRDKVAFEAACFYVHKSPAGPVAGCIIGAALTRLGVPLDELSKYEGIGAGAVVPKVLDLTGPREGVALVMAAVTQDAQDGNGYDRRRTWSEAVAEGEQRAGLELV
jgi:hypothetical protein